MTTHAEETRTAAATIEHPWDARALDWPELTSSSVVVEVGGYKGRWALQIAERYRPRLYVFEPQPWAAAVCREVLGERATVLEYALGTQSAALRMGAWGTDGCSFIDPGSAHEGDMVEIGLAFKRLGIARIDLMLMNIEGYEYTLVPHMLDQGILPERLMIQRHAFADPLGERRQAIAAMLERTHRRIWDYGAMLAAWERAV